MMELGSLLGSSLTSETGEPPWGLSRFSSLGRDFDFLGGLGDLGRGGGDLPRAEDLLFLGLIERDLFLDLDFLSRDLDLRGLRERLGLRLRDRVRERRYLLVSGDLLLLSSYFVRPLRPLDRDLRDLSLLREPDRDLERDLPLDRDLRLPRLSSRSRSVSDFLDRWEDDTSSLRVTTETGGGNGGADSGGGGGGGGATAEFGGGGGGVGCMLVEEEAGAGGTVFGGVVESGE